MTSGRVIGWVMIGAALAALFVSSPIASAQDAEVIFDQAVSAYQRGRFDSAAVGFQQLVRGGIDDPRVWHNVGNCYYKLGNIGHALVAYKRGLRLDPRDPDLNANFRFVKLFASDKIEPIGEFFLEKWWQQLVANFSVYETRWLAAILFWIAGAFTVWKLWPGRSLQRIVVPLVIVWGLWGVTTAMAATAYVRDHVTQSGAIVVTQTNVRGGPGEEYALQFVAHDGLLGEVERRQGEWYLVRFPNGLKGWVPVEDFEII
ncbi:MAG: tetratricopeptide repeat protein [candidate division Zixibacteria bacterium]|nr:tetratricopeptide repeat protein [candidate division Zixibacteria bacterium]